MKRIIDKTLKVIAGAYLIAIVLAWVAFITSKTQHDMLIRSGVLLAIGVTGYLFAVTVKHFWCSRYHQ